MEDALVFYKSLLLDIENRIPGHTKRLNRSRSKDFYELLLLMYNYLKYCDDLAEDYVHMVNDMKREMKYFLKEWKYSCKNQDEAYLRVYSDPDVMSYYMNALFISQLLWTHHFRMLQFFKKRVKSFNYNRVLDIGSGHGLFSWFLKDAAFIDILDISNPALEITRELLGNNKVDYLNMDISLLNTDRKYDFIILGEVLEHLDDPRLMISQAIDHLNADGILWITVPTNAPAIDHVYLFKSKEEVYKMIEEKLKILSCFVVSADNMTQLIGMFCYKK
jgi:2-polyprenyl-3-methyl-5-hydroxy-6-metoxy-1,4-benzoquinol methylase